MVRYRSEDLGSPKVLQTCTRPRLERLFLSIRYVRVDVYDAMPSPGRKFLLAGVGGMNLAHAETYDRFIERYGAQQAWVADWLAAFGPDPPARMGGRTGYRNLRRFIGTCVSARHEGGTAVATVA